jgi:protein-S-isoprenylcysteine O-methyltransferase
VLLATEAGLAFDPRFTSLMFLVCAIWVASELALRLLRRSGGRAESKDAGSVHVLNLAIYAAVGAGVASTVAGVGRVPLPMGVRWFGLALIAAGLAWRWWAILTLRRFFTVDVAIHEGHRLIEAGPYGRVRHPSYAGSLASFYGLALCLPSWVAALVIVVPITVAFVHRIRIEEAALAEALPDTYPAYAKRTARLFPGIY